MAPWPSPRLSLAGVALVAALALAACGDAEPPREAAGPLTSARAEELLAQREALGAGLPEPSSRAPTASAPAPASEPFAVRARVLDARAHPLADGRLARLAIGADGLPVPAESTRADPSGALWLSLDRARLPKDLALVVQLAAPGHVSRQIRVEAETWGREDLVTLGEVLLDEGGDVEGRVRAGSAPCAQALVLLTRELGEADAGERAWARFAAVPALDVPGLLPLARTRDDGTFRLEGMPVGRFGLVALGLPEAGAWLPARIEGLFVRAGETLRVEDLVLVPADASEVVVGSVHTPDGAPVVGVRLVLLDAQGDVTPLRTLSVAEGRFALLAPAGLEFGLRAQDPDGRFEPLDRAEVRAGGPALELRFERPAPPLEWPR